MNVLNIYQAFSSYAQINWAEEAEVTYQPHRSNDPLGLNKDIEMSTQQNVPTTSSAPQVLQVPTTIMCYSTQPSVATTAPVSGTHTVPSTSNPVSTPAAGDATAVPPGMTAYRKKPLTESNQKRAPTSRTS